MESKYPLYTTCEFCGNKFISTHGNRKFCLPIKNHDDGKKQNLDCKMIFNNLKAKEKRDKTKMVSAQQYKNWFGLNQLFTKNKTIVSEADMRSEGIYFETFIITQIIKDTGEEVKCYIEYGLIKLNENQFKIIKHGIHI